MWTNNNVAEANNNNNNNNNYNCNCSFYYKLNGFYKKSNSKILVSILQVKPNTEVYKIINLYLY